MEARVGVVKGSGGREWLRLRWTYGGQRINLSLGIPNDRPNMAIAKKIAARITSDLANDIYDHANYKATYGLKKVGTKPRVISCPELFEKFAEQRLLAESSRDVYRAIASWIKKLLPGDCDRVDARAAGNFLARLQEGVCGNTAKAYISIISACWNWAADSYDLVDPNPWVTVGSRIRSSKVREVTPFSTGDIKKILEAFYQSPQFCFYGDFVRFLINTGARPGEIIPLTWGDFNPSFTEVSINKSYSVRNGLRLTTKTGVSRMVAIAPAVSRMLCDRKKSLRKPPKDTDLVFPAVKGGYLNLKSFSKGAWKNRLKEAGVKYTNVYTLRHSAISHALYEGEDIKQVAQQAGNSPRVVDATYRHSLDKRRSVFKGF